MMENIAIVIAVHDNGSEIKNNLRKYLEQEVEGELQVIVVDDHSTDSTSDVLKRMRQDYPQLYTTFIPASSHRKRRRLALTVGAKAAKGEWVALVDIRYVPENNQWLASLINDAQGSGVKFVAAPCKVNRGSLLKKFRRWRKTRKLRRKVRGSDCFEMPLNNVLVRKDMLICKGPLTASCDSAAWAAGAVLMK